MMRSIKKLILPPLLCLATLTKSTHGFHWMDVTDETDPLRNPNKPDHQHENNNINNNLLRSPPSSSSSYSDPKSIETKSGVCDGYDGILKINSGDKWSAVGTSFFMYVANQIIYAERHNLIPWVHFTDQKSQIYDPDIHARTFTTVEGTIASFKALVGTKITEIIGADDMACSDRRNRQMSYPGPPDYADSELQQYEISLDSSGIWDLYFEPVSAFHPQVMTAADVASCERKPFVDLTEEELLGMHMCSPDALRSWRYPFTPKALWPIEGDPHSLLNWYTPMRERGSEIVQKYFRPQPWLEELIDIVHPIDVNDPPCLAIHIRNTFLGADRRKISPKEILPYVETFLANGGESIYVGTDSTLTIEGMTRDWPADVTSRIERQDQAYLSDSDVPIFERITHHQSNRETLIDIYAMARCGLFLHGHSAIAEATIYVNGRLNRYNVDFEDEDRVDVEGFAEMVREVIAPTENTVVY